MSKVKDTDYLSISTRIRAMENRLLTRERMERMLEARSGEDAAKILSECGYGELSALSHAALDEVLSQARSALYQELKSAAPDPRVVEVFQLKYDYHNAKVLLKAHAMETDGTRLLMEGGRYAPHALKEAFQRDDLRDCSETFRQAVTQARELLSAWGDPQLADFVLDRAYFAEMRGAAEETESAFLQGYVALLIDATNLRSAVRAGRMGKGAEFLHQVLLPGGTVDPQTLASGKSGDLANLFRAGPLGEAAALGAALSTPGSGELTGFERACDDALTAYLTQARRIPFGEQAVIGYLYARESEFTAIRTILSGRMAGLDAETIRERLREAYV